jgi:hypothetical protein
LKSRLLYLAFSDKDAHLQVTAEKKAEKIPELPPTEINRLCNMVDTKKCMRKHKGKPEVSSEYS